MFVLDENNEKKGVMSFFDALALAEEAGLDLVEISPSANPPVCRITDYGKFRYEQEKRLKEAKKNQTIVKLREIRMQPKIDVNDLNVKTKAIGEFIQGGDKCKVTIRFRGRELAHTELGKVVLDKGNRVKVTLRFRGREMAHINQTKGVLDEFAATLADIANVDKPAKMEGRNMSMLLSPVRKK